MLEPVGRDADGADADHPHLSQVFVVRNGPGQCRALGHVGEGAEVFGLLSVGLGPGQVAALVLLEVVALGLVVLDDDMTAVELPVLVEEVDVGAQVGQVLVVCTGRSGLGDANSAKQSHGAGLRPDAVGASENPLQNEPNGGGSLNPVH